MLVFFSTSCPNSPTVETIFKAKNKTGIIFLGIAHQPVSQLTHKDKINNNKHG